MTKASRKHASVILRVLLFSSTLVFPGCITQLDGGHISLIKVDARLDIGLPAVRIVWQKRPSPYFKITFRYPEMGRLIGDYSGAAVIATYCDTPVRDVLDMSREKRFSTTPLRYINSYNGDDEEIPTFPNKQEAAMLNVSQFSFWMSSKPLIVGPSITEDYDIVKDRRDVCIFLVSGGLGDVRFTPQAKIDHLLLAEKWKEEQEKAATLK